MLFDILVNVVVFVLVMRLMYAIVTAIMRKPDEYHYSHHSMGSTGDDKVAYHASYTNDFNDHRSFSDDYFQNEVNRQYMDNMNRQFMDEMLRSSDEFREMNEWNDQMEMDRQNQEFMHESQENLNNFTNTCEDLNNFNNDFNQTFNDPFNF